MRLIDADALKTDLGISNDCAYCETIYRECTKRDKSLSEFCAWINTAPTIDTVPLMQWISTKDRMPKENEPILYCAFGRSVTAGVYRGFDGVHHRWKMAGIYGIHLDNEVTHWMPLPEPPKEEIMITEENLVGKTIKKLDIDGFGLSIVFTDGTELVYSASDGGYSGWHITEPKKDSGNHELSSNYR